MFCFITPATNSSPALFPCFPAQPNLFFLPNSQNQIYNDLGSLMPCLLSKNQSFGLTPPMLVLQAAGSIGNQSPLGEIEKKIQHGLIQENVHGDGGFSEEMEEDRLSGDLIDSTSKQEPSRAGRKTKKIPPKKRSQTKNLIKNYGRAILTFILKNTPLRLRILAHLSIPDTEFLQEVYSYRNHIHTISAIRYLWQQHPYSKAFRILSCEYLRKYNLEHVFNSRVFRYGIYLKYQRKLMRSMERPGEFQSIKEI